MVQVLGGQLAFNHVVQKQVLHAGIDVRGSICKRRCGQVQARAPKGRAEIDAAKSPALLTLETEIERSNEAAILLNIWQLLQIRKITQEVQIIEAVWHFALRGREGMDTAGPRLCRAHGHDSAASPL